MIATILALGGTVTKPVIGLSRSARLNGGVEDVRILALVIPELKLIDVQVQVFLADFMEGSDNATFDDRPKPFDSVRMNCAADILAIRMMHRAVPVGWVQLAIAAMVVRREQADLVRYGFIHEAFQGGRICPINHASHHVALSLHGSDHDGLARSACSAKVSTSAFAFVLILGLSADIGFGHFHIANQFLELHIAQGHADLVTHEPCGFVGAKTHVPAHLKGANPLLAGEHQVNDAEPLTQGLVGVLKDRSNQDGKAIADTAWRALIALPVILLGVGMHIVIFATWARHTIGPSVVHQILSASRVIREHALKVTNRHLMNLKAVFLFSSHGQISREYDGSMPC